MACLPQPCIRLRPIALVVLVMASLVIVSPALEQQKKAKVDRLVRQVMRCANIPAVGLAMVGLKAGAHYVKAYGTSDAASNTRASIDTRFCLGEATEAFTAVLLAKLISENENVTWSTPIEEIIGKRVVLPDEYRSRNINLMDILAQRSGMPTMDILTVARPYSAYRLVGNLRYVTPAAGFREKYIPNQVMFSMLEDVFQALGGDTWENLLKDHILKPLEMSSVMFLGKKTAADAANVAYPVIYSQGKAQALSLESFKGLSVVKSASTLCLSAIDLSKWLRFLLHGKAANGVQILDPSALKATFSGIQPRGHGDDPERVGYRQPHVQVSYSRQQNALGWITGHYRGYQFISQDGSIAGSNALSTILPSGDVAVFATFTGGSDKALAAKVLLNIFSLDILIGGKGWFSDDIVCGLMDEMRDLHPHKSMHKHEGIIRLSNYEDERPLSSYVGYYRNYGYGDVFIKYNETEDRDLLMEYGQAVYRMAPTNFNDTFQLIARGHLWYSTNADNYRNNMIIAKFAENERDPEKRISSLTISGFAPNDLEFSTNPVVPHFEASQEADAHCSASINSAVSTLCLLVLTMLHLYK